MFSFSLFKFQPDFGFGIQKTCVRLCQHSIIWEILVLKCIWVWDFFFFAWLLGWFLKNLIFVHGCLQVTESGKQERHLVATVGKFSVIWDFQQVKNSAHECYRNQQGLKSCYCYKILLKDESIVESRFMHDKYAVSDSPEAPLVVATPMKVSSISLSGKRWSLCIWVHVFVSVVHTGLL